MTVNLQLYEPCADGIKYLLAQSPDTESLVPSVSEAEWEDFGRRKGVKVRAWPPSAERALNSDLSASALIDSVAMSQMS